MLGDIITYAFVRNVTLYYYYYYVRQGVWN